ncbi:transposase [Bacillus sp. SD088]|uniref:transposase n=1 Tax=Bacillus sp. SD088 TaxID=2782012 RepID=UPI001A969E54|nr:transposase [Bacillus sp. SD088]MBO0996143.1 transposase [Bacillus sp. SD088]
MAEKHKSYSVEFREYVTKMVVLDGHKITEMSKKLAIPYGTLKRWVQEYRKKQKETEKESQNQLLTATEYKELYEKERQAKLEMEEENEILKKAMHIFTQEKE